MTKIDGVIAVNELSWLKKPPHPSKIVNLNDDIDEDSLNKILTNYYG